MKRWQQITSKWAQALWVLIAIAALFPKTGLSQRDSGQLLSSAETERAVQALSKWFECEDCGAGDLTAVTRYGQSVVPSLIAALNAGPSPARRERLRRSLDAGYDRRVEQARKMPTRKIASNKEEYVARYVDNFDAQYRIRAAQALAAIGGADAREALEAALGKAQRADVRTAIQQSLYAIR
jgi:hypothetical protein